jgi:hypothetical protein
MKVIEQIMKVIDRFPDDYVFTYTDIVTDGSLSKRACDIGVRGDTGGKIGERINRNDKTATFSV